MKRNFLAYGIVFLSLCCFVDLSVGWSCFIFIALAALLFFQQRGLGTPLPPVFLVLLAYVLGYPVVVVIPWMYQDLWAHMNPYIIGLAMLWACRGFAAFCCAYLLGDALTRRFHKQKHHGWDDAERLAYVRYAVHTFGIVAIAAWAVRQYYWGLGLTVAGAQPVVDVNSAGSSIIQALLLLISLRDPFFFLFGIMYIRRLHDRFMSILFVGMVATLLPEIIGLGSKGAIIRLLVIATLVIAYTTRRLNLKQFCAGALMIMIVYMSFLVITEYRQTFSDKYRRGEDVFSFSVQAEAFSGAFLASLPFSEKSQQRRTDVDKTDVLSRIASGIFSFGYMLYFTGERSPYEYAWQTFLIPVYSLVPRALVDKPIFLNPGRFGREYFHSSTAISVSALGAFYHAWGYGGIVAGMAFIGVTMAFLIRRTLLRVTALNSTVFMVVMVMGLVEVGGSFFGALNHLSRLAVILLGLYLLYPMLKRLRGGHAAMALPAMPRIGGGYEPPR